MIGGSILVGGQDRVGVGFFRAVDPATGEQIEPALASAGARRVDGVVARV